MIFFIDEEYILSSICIIIQRVYNIPKVVLVLKNYNEILRLHSLGLKNILEK